MCVLKCAAYSQKPAKSLETSATYSQTFVPRLPKAVMVPSNNIVANAEAMAILEEAEVAAESRLKSKFPEIGLDAPIQKRASLEA